MSDLLDEAAPGLSVSDRQPLTMRAMRLAERAHRGARRKAPEGEDQPVYFLHVAEVAWRLADAGMPAHVVAAGFLHDVIEDCGYTRESLARAVGDDYVAELVEWVSEPGGRHASWHARNAAYRERIARAPEDALALSCADKTSNIEDMLRLVRRGYRLDQFLSVGAKDQLAKFEQLRRIFLGRTPDSLLLLFDAALGELALLNGSEDTQATGGRNG